MADRWDSDGEDDLRRAIAAEIVRAHNERAELVQLRVALADLRGCGDCGGTGEVGNDDLQCTRCGGTGQIDPMAEVERLAEQVKRLRAELDEYRHANTRMQELIVRRADERDRAEARQRTAEADVDRLAEQVKRVRDRHAPVSAHGGDPDDDDNLTTACVHCDVLYPCDTIRDLDGQQDDEQDGDDRG